MQIAIKVGCSRLPTHTYAYNLPGVYIHELRCRGRGPFEVTQLGDHVREDSCLSYMSLPRLSDPRRAVPLGARRYRWATGLDSGGYTGWGQKQASARGVSYRTSVIRLFVLLRTLGLSKALVSCLCHVLRSSGGTLQLAASRHRAVCFQSLITR